MKAVKKSRRKRRIWFLEIQRSYLNLPIRSKIAWQFTFIVAILLILIFSSVLVSFSIYRKLNFSNQLKQRAIIAAEAFLSKDNVTKEKFQEIQNKYQKAIPRELIALYDPKNKPVFIEKQGILYASAIIDEIRLRKELAFIKGDRECFGIYYHDNQGDFVIISSAVDLQGRKLVRFSLLIMGSALLLSLSGVYFLGLIFAKNALSPISNVIQQVSKMEANNLNARVEEGRRKDEIGLLAKTFNNLLSRLEKTFEMQKTFVSGASHEFRTPITSMIGELEVGLSKPREPKDYIIILENLLIQAEKLNEITESLLNLTRTGNEFFSKDPVRLDQLIFDTIDNLPKNLSANRIEIEFRDLPLDYSDLIIYANKSLLMVALGNILSNALKFSKDRKVFCCLYYKDQHNFIEVKDQGIGMELEEMNHIFQPFFRGKNARGFQGTGIGLSLTEKIIKMYQGDLLVESTLGLGTQFKIRLPINSNVSS